MQKCISCIIKTVIKRKGIELSTMQKCISCIIKTVIMRKGIELSTMQDIEEKCN